MKLIDLQKRMDQMSTEELLERLRQIRHNRFVERPAAKKRVADKGVKEGRKKASEVDKLLAGLSDEDRAALIQQLADKLGGSNEAGGQGEDDPSGSTGGRGEVPG